MQNQPDTLARGLIAIVAIVILSIASWGAIPAITPSPRTVYVVITPTPALDIVRAPAGPKIEPTATATPAPTSTPELQPTAAPQLDQPAAEQPAVVYAAEQDAPATPEPVRPATDFYDTSTLPTPGAWLVEACASPAGQRSWICGAPAAPTQAPTIHFVEPNGAVRYSWTCGTKYGDWRDNSGVYRHPECEVQP